MVLAVFCAKLFIFWVLRFNMIIEPKSAIFFLYLINNYLGRISRIFKLSVTEMN